jgi:hypothetical protein
MNRLFVTFWINEEGDYKLPSVCYNSRYTLKFKELESRKIILPENFIKAFNENWAGYYGIIQQGKEGYLYKSEISINI